MASRSTNTMVEALQKMLRDIADMKTLADADMPFLVQLETTILNEMKKPVDALRQQGVLPPADPNGGMPPMGGGMGGMPAGSPMGGGMTAGAQAPSQDELSRLLGAGAPGMQ